MSKSIRIGIRYYDDVGQDTCEAIASALATPDSGIQRITVDVNTGTAVKGSAVTIELDSRGNMTNHTYRNTPREPMPGQAEIEGVL